MRSTDEPLARKEDGLLGKIVAFCLENKFVVLLILIGIVFWGIMVAPFDWKAGDLPRDPVPVDAIPDIGENQQIVFTEWMGRSPQDMEDQVTYPLTSALLGLPDVKTVRSFSMFGFSSIYVIFNEDVDFYWSRTRVLEKLNSLPQGSLPDDVKPTLGPDATPLGQVFWYTLEGKDKDGKPTGGWDLHELRGIQDWQVRYELLAVPGVSEVASVGGFVQEYQVDLDPDAMRAHNVTLQQVVKAVKSSNLDVGARTLEINRVEYIIRGLGFVETITDIEDAVVKATDNVPIRVRDVARVALGPALRRGALDKSGAEAVGGVVVVRYGANPLAVIKRVNEKIAQIASTLPEKTVNVRQPDGTTKEISSKVSLVPFYDRTGLIKETLQTLETALWEEMLVTIIVVILMLMHLRSSALISGLLPIAVLMCFIAMKIFGVDANVVALSGIAIAIGTMVDMGIVLNENILRKLTESKEGDSSLQVVYDATIEVGSAVLTAVLTTVISFLPVFTMEAAEGKLFKPLAWTKTFALLSSLIVALALIPPIAHMLFPKNKTRSGWPKYIYPTLLTILAIAAVKLSGSWLPGLVILIIASYQLLGKYLPEQIAKQASKIFNYFAVLVVAVFLTRHWMPLGIDKGLIRNLVFVVGTIGGFLLMVYVFYRFYSRILKWCLNNKGKFLLLPTCIIILGLIIWQGLGKEFMPSLDEGSFLLMPTTMPHASIGEAMDVLRKQDMALTALPEVEMAVGKIGRAETPLDPAPISMIETLINYKDEYFVDAKGNRLFKMLDAEVDLFRNEDGVPMLAPDGEPYNVKGKFVRDNGDQLIPDPKGKPFRLWRPALDPALNEGRVAWAGIRNPNDIWDEIIRVTEIPGTTSAPILQPIAARIVMLQSGMRAPMGVKIFGKGKITLEQLESVGIQMERFLREVPSVKAASVNAERIVGKPYLEIDIDRKAIARYNVNITDVQNVIQTAIGGMPVTTTVEGRERYKVQVRYKRELRDTIESLERVLVPAGLMDSKQQIPLKNLIKEGAIQYRRGPQVIKSEESALVTYVLFDKKPGHAEVDVKEDCERYLQAKAVSGDLKIPEGVTYKFAGTFENQIRSEKRLQIVLPLAMFIIFMILYFQFRSITTSMLVFTGVLVAWSGGFIMIWLYGQGWFFNFSFFGVDMRELFQMHPINLSVAIWVGFLALFGIATDDGVVMATFLRQSFKDKKPSTIAEIRTTALRAGERRVRPCLMTTATTILALLPVLTSTGRGADIMVPMAIPTFGGMIIEFLTMFVVPVLYCAIQEIKLHADSDPTV